MTVNYFAINLCPTQLPTADVVRLLFPTSAPSLEAQDIPAIKGETSCESD
jgi:hypothetical protein